MPGNENLWSCIPTDSCATPAGVEVWAAWLDLPGQRLSGFWSTLSSQEQERAGRFAQERERERFVAARGFLRSILGSCLGVEPYRIELELSTKGKPSLGGALACSGLEFNLAHSGGLGVIAVSRCGMVGVDVEQVRPVPELGGVIERFFSARECAEIRKQSGEEALAAFFKLWTRKEAWLKAAGEGITGALDCIEVVDLSQVQRQPGRPRHGKPGVRLHLFDLAPAPGFVGALAVSAS